MRIFQRARDTHNSYNVQQESHLRAGLLYRLWYNFQSHISGISWGDQPFQLHSTNIITAEVTPGTHTIQGRHQPLAICTGFVIQSNQPRFSNGNQQIFRFREFCFFLRRYSVLNIHINSCFQYISEFYTILCQVLTSIIVLVPLAQIRSAPRDHHARTPTDPARSSLIRDRIRLENLPVNVLCTEFFRVVPHFANCANLCQFSHQLLYTQPNYIKPPTHQSTIIVRGV